MKTTVDIADGLLAAAREVAAEEGTTIRALIEEGLRHAVERRRSTQGFHLRRASFRGSGLHVDVREGTWRYLRDRIYEARRVIAVDTNLLVYAHREESPWHTAAYGAIERLAQAPSAWAIPWPCLHEFLAIVTHPRIYQPPTPVDAAADQVAAWLEAPNLALLTESQGYWGRLREMIERGRIAGPQIHDGRIAALCLHHGVRELWTADRDFSRFPELTVRNPLVESAG